MILSMTPHRSDDQGDLPTHKTPPNCGRRRAANRLVRGTGVELGRIHEFPKEFAEAGTPCPGSCPGRYGGADTFKVARGTAQSRDAQRTRPQAPLRTAEFAKGPSPSGKHATAGHVGEGAALIPIPGGISARPTF